MGTLEMFSLISLPVLSQQMTMFVMAGAPCYRSGCSAIWGICPFGLLGCLRGRLTTISGNHRKIGGFGMPLLGSYQRTRVSVAPYNGCVLSQLNSLAQRLVISLRSFPQEIVVLRSKWWNLSDQTFEYQALSERGECIPSNSAILLGAAF
jgi:hypothetical protein